jgi:hypothetical protein
MNAPAFKSVIGSVGFWLKLGVVSLALAFVTSLMPSQASAQSLLLVTEVSPPFLTTVEIEPSSATIFANGTQQFEANGFDQFENPIESTFSWYSSDTEVATIDSETGLATAVAVGTVTITAYAQNETSSTAVLTVTETPMYTLTYSAGEHGSVSGEASQTVNHGESGTELIAVADDGFHFVRWDDGSTDNPRTDMNVTEAHAVTAIFNNDSTGGSSGSRASRPSGQVLGTTVAQVSQTSGSSGFVLLIFTKDLYQGLADPDVSRLQKVLADAGFPIAAGVTGYFGSQTFAAVQAYQKSRGIINSGYFGPITRAQLNKELTGG